jgi:hypothetical protein
MADYTQEIPPVKIAFIIDNQVVDILHTDERLGAIFLSEPVIKDVSDKMPLESHNIVVGATYDPLIDEYSLPVEE